MSRNIYDPSLDLTKYAAQIDKGGTGALSAEDAAINLNLLTLSMKNIPGGVVGTDSNNLIPSVLLPVGFVTGNASVNVTGPASLVVGDSATFLITDFDSFVTYVIIPISGTLTRVGNVITYTAPTFVDQAGFIINGRFVEITITTSIVVTRPVITSPANNAVNQAIALTLTSNAFATTGGSDTHVGSDWQIATDSGFSNIVKRLINASGNKTSWAVTGLTSSNTYYARVRYKSANSSYSEWSVTLTFSTINAGTVTRPTVTNPADGAVNQPTSIGFTSSLFAVVGGTPNHEGSDWQLATDAGFTNIVQQVVNSNLSRITWNVSGMVTGNVYYVRVRHKDTIIGYSAWSIAISFSTSAVVTYAVVPTLVNVAEGNSVIYNINTANVANGTELFWSISGTGITAADFSDNTLTGSVTINGNSGSVSRTIALDYLSETTEDMLFQLRSVSPTGTVLATSAIVHVLNSAAPPNTAPVFHDMNTPYPLLVEYYNANALLFPTGNVTDQELGAAGSWNGAILTITMGPGGILLGGDPFSGVTYGPGEYSNYRANVIAFNSPVTVAYENTLAGYVKVIRNAGKALGTVVTPDANGGYLAITPVTTRVTTPVMTINFSTNTTQADINAVIQNMRYYYSDGLIHVSTPFAYYTSITITLTDGNISNMQGNGGALSATFTAPFTFNYGYL